MKARNKRLIDQHNELAWLALETSALQRTKRLPRLDSILIKYPDRRVMTKNELKQVVKRIAEIYR